MKYFNWIIKVRENSYGYCQMQILVAKGLNSSSACCSLVGGLRQVQKLSDSPFPCLKNRDKIWLPLWISAKIKGSCMPWLVLNNLCRQWLLLSCLFCMVVGLRCALFPAAACPLLPQLPPRAQRLHFSKGLDISGHSGGPWIPQRPNLCIFSH